MSNQEYIKGLLISASAGLLMGAMFVGAICYDEAKKLDTMDDIPEIVYEPIDKELLESLANCNSQTFLTPEECSVIHGLR